MFCWSDKWVYVSHEAGKKATPGNSSLSVVLHICSWIRGEHLRQESCFLIQYYKTSCWWTMKCILYIIFCYSGIPPHNLFWWQRFHPPFILPGNKDDQISFYVQYCNSLSGIEFPLILHLVWHAGGNMNFRKSMCWDTRQEWSYEPLSHLEFIGNVNSHHQLPLNPSQVLACQDINIQVNAIFPDCSWIKLSVFISQRLQGEMTWH